MSLDAALRLRHALHAHPEPSGAEHGTAERVHAFLEALEPDELLCGLGGTGLAACFGDAGRGPTVLLRAELDALSVREANGFAHRSTHAGHMHACGHDGHMAILAAVGARLAEGRPRGARVVLLFQPAEETGEGARAVVLDPRFARLRPAFVFGLHNVPGWPLGSVVVREGTFACASRGLAVRLSGRTAHAAQPETGLAPTLALARLLAELAGPPPLDPAGGLVARTVVGATLGSRDFGIAPAEAELWATLRCASDEGMARLVRDAEAAVEREAGSAGLAAELSWSDVFDATVNAPEAVALVRRACRASGHTLVEAPEPFRWSEDFGVLAREAPGCFFGLGAGLDAPALHRADYDFPDALIGIGAELFLAIVEACLAEPS